MSGLIGKKIGMTSLYDSAGKNVACTVLQAGPCFVSQIKTNEKMDIKRFNSLLMIKMKKR